MFERIKTYAINGQIRYKEAQILKDQIGQLKNLTESNTVVEDRDQAEFTLLGGKINQLDSQDRQTLLEQVNKVYFKNGHGRNIIRLFEKYVVGRRFSVEAESQTPAVKEFWDEFWILNKMDLRKKEIVRRGIRDGEVFLRYFEEAKKPLSVRFMNPAWIHEPDDKVVKNVTHGIETDPEDIEVVLNYYYKNKPIPAEEVQHIKILTDSDDTRGRSFLEPMLESLEMYKKWLKDRMKLNEIRNTVALIKKIKGTPAQAANVVAKYPTTRKTNEDGTTLAKAPKNVSVFTTNQNVDYELKSPNLQAADVQKDGRALLLAISAAGGLPEFMVTSDASNGSYASTMIAEGPAVKEFEDWQDFFGHHFKEMFRRVIKYGIEIGRIPEKEDIEEEEIDAKTGEVKMIKTRKDTSTKCSITFPDLVSRDIDKETTAYIKQNNQGWLSGQTASARLDLDYDIEQKQIEQAGQGSDEETPEEEEARVQKEKEDMGNEE